MHRRVILLVIGLSLPQQSRAQSVATVEAWFSAAPCNTNEVALGVPDSKSPAQFLMRARRLADELPPGPEQAIARTLSRELARELGDGRLEAFCRDSTTGEFVARYPSDLDTASFGPGTTLTEVRVQAQNLGAPEIAFDVVELPDDRGFAYFYRVSNNSGARQPITEWGVLCQLGDGTIESTHPIWHTISEQEAIGDAWFSLGGRSGNRPTEAVKTLPVLPRNLVRWMTRSNEYPIRAGQSLAMFVLTSKFRPGWTTAFIGSKGEVRRPEGPIPDTIARELRILLRPMNNYLPVVTIGPQFGLDSSRSRIAGDWSLGIQQMIRHGELTSQSTYVVALLDTLLQIEKYDPDLQFKIKSRPKSGMEMLIDKVIRLAL